MHGFLLSFSYLIFPRETEKGVLTKAREVLWVGDKSKVSDK